MEDIFKQLGGILNPQTEIESLQNMANVIGLKVHEKYSQDKRKTVKMYFAQRGNETVSPTLDYEQLNHFMLGWIKATKFIKQ